MPKAIHVKDRDWLVPACMHHPLLRVASRALDEITCALDADCSDVVKLDIIQMIIEESVEDTNDVLTGRGDNAST